MELRDQLANLSTFKANINQAIERVKSKSELAEWANSHIKSISALCLPEYQIEI